MDVTKEQVSNLHPETTVSNFGKLNKTSSKADIIIGIQNAIIETIGVMGAFLCKNDDIKDIIVTGTLAQKIPETKDSLNRVEALHDIKFYLPKDGEFATAYGATLI